MTDITKLAQRMKAAAVRAKTATEEYASGHMSVSVCYAECKEFNRLTDGPDNILALVEALEKAQAAERRWHRVASRIHEQACESDVKIDELEAIRAAAEKLVRCKGRYHSEQNYQALVALFGVNTPDLPPLEHENVHYADAAEMEIEALRQRIAELEREQEHLRPVGVMSEQAFHRLENRECRFIALWPRPGIFLPRKRPEDGVIVYARTAAAAGIKVEAE
ncbi:ead/Ea22-like family protein [Klebsiella pneumoniae]|uniref:ead/Ea22-like family protein n=1 Tax=Klebsiella pneumoniae TaxID=573 RepID=UPI0013C3165A|nr:ead/Ea22-like family protein [Klebsiella pneumoniae]